MRIRGRKPSADCSVSFLPSSSSPSTSSSSITAANSSSSSQDSSNSCSSASHRCHGLDLLVKAIYQVTAGSVVGVPYIQRRVTIRRRRRLGIELDVSVFGELSERRNELLAENVCKGVKKGTLKQKKQKMKKGKSVMGLTTTIQDSALHPWGRRSDLAPEMGLSVRVVAHS